jgi:hypothetical protein
LAGEIGMIKVQGWKDKEVKKRFGLNFSENWI